MVIKKTILYEHYCHFPSDVDECTNGNHTCDDNSDCINTDGSYECVCKPDYTRNGETCMPFGNNLKLGQTGICHNNIS